MKWDQKVGNPDAETLAENCGIVDPDVNTDVILKLGASTSKETTVRDKVKFQQQKL